MTEPALVNRFQASHALSCRPSELRRFEEAGLPYVNVDGFHRYDPLALLAWVSRASKPATPPASKPPASKPPAKPAPKPAPKAAARTLSPKTQRLAAQEYDRRQARPGLARRMGAAPAVEPSIRSTPWKLTLGEAREQSGHEIVGEVAREAGIPIAPPKVSASSTPSKIAMDTAMGVQRWDPRIVTSTATKLTFGGFTSDR